MCSMLKMVVMRKPGSLAQSKGRLHEGACGNINISCLYVKTATRLYVRTNTQILVALRLTVSTLRPKSQVDLLNRYRAERGRKCHQAP